ncbi:MAG: carboxypeptidase regulatory-like domain-containing protein [Planctomycetota bacterium]
MRKMWGWMWCWIVVLALGADAEAQKSECRGTVVGTDGKPVDGALVTLIEVSVRVRAGTMESRAVAQLTTGSDGAFQFEHAPPAGNSVAFGLVIAEKEGQALGWADWRLFEGKNLEAKITLGPPTTIAGTVLDAAGTPVAGAQVHAVLVTPGTDEPTAAWACPALEALTRRTDKDGHFAFDRVPQGAAADFAVSAPGKATIYTIKAGETPGTYPAGETNVTITLPEQARLEGRVVDGESGKPLPGVELVVSPEDESGTSTYLNPYRAVAAQSAQDGSFHLGGLNTGSYAINLAETWKGSKEWTLAPLTVEARAGEVTSGIKVELGKGGVLEVIVKEAGTEKPIPQVLILLDFPSGSRLRQATTGDNGCARFFLEPGEYEGFLAVKEGYQQFQEDETLTVEAGKTTEFVAHLERAPKITGVVVDSEDRPVAGALVAVMPLSRGEVTTDDQGAFTVESDWSVILSDDSEVESFLWVRHPERNLGAHVPVGEPGTPLRVVVQPGVTFLGNVLTSEGRPIPNAKIRLSAREGNYSSSLGSGEISTDAEGRYRIAGITPGLQLGVEARAEGYGRRSTAAYADGAPGETVELDDIVLDVADQAIAGIVLGEDGKPVSGASLYIYGDGQQQRNATSGIDGRFRMSGLCEGTVTINARFSPRGARDQTNLQGSAQVMAGTTDVEITLGPEQSYTNYRADSRAEPKPLLGKPLPSLADLDIDFDLKEASGKKMLVCLWDMNQRPSRHMLKTLAAEAEKLEEQGVVVVTIEASGNGVAAVLEWVSEAELPFTVATMDEEIENALLAWGAHGLPWLIVTDASHVVRAEGIALDAIAATLAQLDKE